MIFLSLRSIPVASGAYLHHHSKMWNPPEFKGIGASGQILFGGAGQDFGKGKAGWHDRNR